jgi:hypothetical protein
MDISYLIIIGARKSKDDILNALVQNGGHAITSYYGRGAVQANEFLQILGLVAEQNKIIITAILKTENAKNMIALLDEEFNFNKFNTGIAFTIPVESGKKGEKQL